MAQAGFTARGPTKWRGFWAFFAIGFVANLVFYTALLIWAVVSADFLKHNPNRTVAQAWHQIAMSPFLAVSLTLFGSLLALVIAALAAKYVCETTGRFPLSLVAVLLVICSVATFLQMTLLGLHTWSGNPHKVEEILRIVVAQVPMLLAFWLWGREPVGVAAALDRA
jgi:MFS family permease